MDTTSSVTQESKEAGHKRELLLRRWLEKIIKILLVISLSGLAISIHYLRANIYLFSIISLILLLLWKYAIRYPPARAIPRSVIVLSFLYFLHLVLSALISENQDYIFFEYKAFKYFLIGGLLFTAPLDNRYRKIILGILFASSAIDGLVGILQYYDILHAGPYRPFGMAVFATVFAAKLSFILGCAILLLSVRPIDLFDSVAGRSFLFIVVLLTAGGVIASGARGSWVAFIATCPFILFLYDRRKAIVFLVVLIAFSAVVLAASHSQRTRATSILTSIFHADAKQSTGNRFELWKGSVLLFMESPIIGKGAGGFQANIDRLVREKKLKEMTTTVHAHSMIFQTLATQGLAGGLLLIAFIAVLLWWGIGETKQTREVGGYVLLYCVLLTIGQGLTDYYFTTPHYFSISFLLIGLIGPYESRSSVPECTGRVKKEVHAKCISRRFEAG